jgi:hypothetical protein
MATPASGLEMHPLAGWSSIMSNGGFDYWCTLFTMTFRYSLSSSSHCLKEILDSCYFKMNNKDLGHSLHSL